MVIGEWLSSFMVSVVWTKFTHIPFIGEGIVHIQERANCS